MEKASPIQQPARFRSLRSGIWIVALGSALWGIDPLFRILLVKSLTSSQIVLLEHVLLMLFAIPVLWIHRAELRGLRLSHVLALLFLSWGGSAIATILFTAAFANGNPNTVLLLQKMQPLFAILMARIVLKETWSKHFLLLLPVALLGTYLLTFDGLHAITDLSDVVTTSALMSLGAAALWGGSTVMGRLMLDKMRFETVTSLRFVLALPLLIVITWTEGAPWPSLDSGFNWSAMAINLLLQAFLPGLLSLLLYYRGLSTTKASYATLAELAFPAVGVLINWTVFQEAITRGQLAGFLLIWGVLIVLSRQTDQ